MAIIFCYYPGLLPRNFKCFECLECSIVLFLTIYPLIIVYYMVQTERTADKPEK